jgi:hypothetical protein
MLAETEGKYSLGVMSSSRMTLRLALSQAPEYVEGEEYKNFNPQVLRSKYWL